MWGIQISSICINSVAPTIPNFSFANAFPFSHFHSLFSLTTQRCQKRSHLQSEKRFCSRKAAQEELGGLISMTCRN